MAMDRLNWQPTCCGWHGEYAEHPLSGGGVARVKRSPTLPVGTVLICRFGLDNKPIDKDEEGVPAYVEMSENEADAMLA